VQSPSFQLVKELEVVASNAALAYEADMQSLKALVT
jgi:hypothetical protein